MNLYILANVSMDIVLIWGVYFVATLLKTMFTATKQLTVTNIILSFIIKIHIVVFVNVFVNQSLSRTIVHFKSHDFCQVYKVWSV